MFRSEWLPQPEALQALGISRATMHRLRCAGVLRDGVHIYRAGLGQRAPLRINVAAAELALQVHTLATHASPAQN